ncbi:helix-turn-helix transcriptional regulator [Streptomyces broussonetiae]|uniref:LuxR family transcriptional regulator n=1 Tax=Streptomyces broussonetiae TaxID=2686304 RepID=A0A6I6N529_9ACTN|nr:LuxR C-terminal-related transcriptional regulator [Streptomyces broussonetiae]QHA06574.1 LuxR family transcriptional regulator [Streptomyces broussonetiae]
MSSLIDNAVALHRDTEAEVPLAIPVEPDEASITAAIAEQICQARQSVDICFAEHTTRARRVIEILRARNETVRVRIARSEPGRHRVPEHWEDLAASEHIELRIARVPLIDCVIVDGRSAVLIADSALGPQASLTRSDGVADALHALFAAVWCSATPVPVRIDWDGHARATFVKQVLGCLNSGMTDEQAADELSVSMRTYRRHVARIMATLGANSRFQAGLRAAELGLLPSPVPRAAPPES